MPAMSYRGMDTSADLNTIIERVLRESLEEIGGTSVRDSVMYYLKEKYHVGFDRLSSNPAPLVDALSDIFGVGERLIEKKMVEKMASDLKLKGGETNLVQMIKEARQITQS